MDRERRMDLLMIKLGRYISIKLEHYIRHPVGVRGFRPCVTY